MSKTNKPGDDSSGLKTRAQDLGLFGLLGHWDELLIGDGQLRLPLNDLETIRRLIEWEEDERKKRGLQRRQRSANLGAYKDFADFDFSWPKRIDRDLIHDVFEMGWLEEVLNILFIGPNGVGKTMLAKNLLHRAIMLGYSAKCVSASKMLSDLASQDGSAALHRRIRSYCQPYVLCIDELGYLSYDNRYADLLFEVVSGRYREKPTVVTTNKPFAEWSQVFPNAGCVVTLVDRLIHQAEIVSIAGDSYRLKEAKEGQQKRKKNRTARRSRTTAAEKKPIK